MNLKYLPIYFLLVLISRQTSANDRLETADSLFTSAMYTEAFDLYYEIYEEEDIASPAMLLRMAFIKEGLNDYVQALYFLKQYQEITGDREVLDKMQEIAEANALYGYEYDDQDFIMGLLSKYRRYLLLGLILTSGLLLGYFFYNKLKKRSYGLSLFFQGVVVVLALVLTNFVNQCC